MFMEWEDNVDKQSNGFFELQGTLLFISFTLPNKAL